MMMPTWTGRAGALVLGVSLALAAAVPAPAQQAVDARLTRIRAELPAAAVERIEAQLQQAAERGLPVEPLLDKAVEGIAKGVPGLRIAGAVTQLGGQLGQARALLGNGVPPAAVDVAAVADALRRGVPEHAVRRIHERAGPEEPVAMAVHTVGDLMDQGVPVDQALGVLEAWRTGGATAGELRDLPAAVERLIRQGSLPAQAAAAVTGAMRSGAPPGVPGNRPGGEGVGPRSGPPVPPGAGPPDNAGRGNGKGKGKPPGGGGPPGGG